MHPVFIDLDGVLYEGEQAVPGAVAAVEWLVDRRVAHLFLTNTTSRPRRALVQKLRGLGIHTDEVHILTPSVAAAQWLREHAPGPAALFVPEPTLADFAAVSRCDAREDSKAASVVLGDLGERWEFGTLNRAFRILMANPDAVLVALGMTRYWNAGDGLRLDVAPFVSALECATGRGAVVVGKPSRAFFETAAQMVGAGVPPAIMIGDDIVGDVGGAQRAGLAGILVRTGKFREPDLAGDIRPDAVLDSIADLPAWLEKEFAIGYRRGHAHDAGGIMAAPSEFELEHCLVSESRARELLTGREERQPGGRQMDAKAQIFGTFSKNVRPPDVIPEPEEARAQLRKLIELLDDPAPELARVDDLDLPGPARALPARVYCSRRPGEGAAPPVLLYLHGGGWVQGDLETHHGTCARLAQWSGLMVVALHYRLAPEHPFPAGVEDSLAAYRWLREHAEKIGGDPARVAIAGDSAGGNLAAVVCQQMVTSGEPAPDFAVLVYPALDVGWRTASHEQMPDAFILPRIRMQWYVEQYLASPELVDDPRVSPLRAADLRGQPPTLIVTGGFDPLRDEGKEYAERLAQAGCDVTYHEYPGQIHLFFSVTRAIPAGLDCQREVADYMRQRYRLPGAI